MRFILAAFAAAIAALLLLGGDPSGTNASSSSISGTAFLDFNENGTREAPEPTLNVSVNLAGDGVGLIDSGSDYTFEGLSEGTYTLSLEGFNGCQDPFNYTWLGQYVVGWCTENPVPRMETAVNLSPDTQLVQDIAVVLDIDPTYTGRIWIDGEPATAQQTIDVRIDGELCDSVLTFGQGGYSVFEWVVPTAPSEDCIGETVSFHIGEDQLFSTIWGAVWSHLFAIWTYDDDFPEVQDMVWPPARTVALNNVPSGSRVTAFIDGRPCATAVKTSWLPRLFVAAETEEQGCGRPGDAITYCIDGLASSGLDTWSHSVRLWAWYVSPTDEPCPSRVNGDAECDGLVDVKDALEILVSDTGEHLAACFENADNNCDVRLDPVDALRVLRFDAGLPVAPAGCPPIGAIRDA